MAPPSDNRQDFNQSIASGEADLSGAAPEERLVAVERMNRDLESRVRRLEQSITSLTAQLGSQTKALGEQARKYRQQVLTIQANAEALQRSAAFRLGRALIQAAKRPWEAPRQLPRDLYGIAAQYVRKHRQSAVRTAMAPLPRKPRTDEAAEPARRLPSTLRAIGKPLVSDDLGSGWHGWLAKENVSLGRCGRLVLRQTGGRPGVRKEEVVVGSSRWYRLSFSGDLSNQHGRVLIAISDQGRERLLLPSSGRGMGVDRELSVVFRTLRSSSRVSIALVIEEPNDGEALTLKNVELVEVDVGETCAARAQRLGLADGEEIIASLASIPGRREQLEETVSSLLPQVDRLRVFLNGYADVPSFLRQDRIEVCRSQDWGDLGDAGKFFWAAPVPGGYRLTCDDDLVYPWDYIDVLVSSLRRYGNSAVVGIHGVLLKQPLRDYYSDSSRFVLSFAGELASDRGVQLLGTGTVAYHTSAIRLERRSFAYRNMADIWLAVEAQRQGVPLVALRRPRHWILQNGDAAGSIYEQSSFRFGSARDSGAMQSHVIRCAQPMTIRPARHGMKPRRKLVLAITTYNRVEYLRSCIESFVATLNTSHDWVLVVADDGSTDGTLDYLEHLTLPVELHVIRNQRRYAVGQTNSIFELCRRLTFDVGFKVDDDVVFKQLGWEDLYLNAITASGLHHLCYLNVAHLTELRRRSNPLFELPPPVTHPSGKLESFVDAYHCMGALFTFTPAVLERVGDADEENFPIRGHWHIDYSVRCCRAGFNDEQSFFDAAESNLFIELQNNIDAHYRASLEWGDEYRRVKDPAELARRQTVIDDRSRILLTHKQAPTRPRPTRINDFFERVLVLNLDRRVDRWRRMVHLATTHQLAIERVAAVDGKCEPHASSWRSYSRELPTEPPTGSRAVRSSREYYLDYDSQVARVSFIEGRLRRKAIQSPGAWGYLETMIALLKRAIEEDWESVLVLDDDARFHRDLNDLFAHAVADVPDDWLVLQLGSMQYQWDLDWITWLTERVYCCNGSSVGSYAVGLHRAAFPMLLEHAQRFDLPYDEGALHAVKRAYAERCFTLFPSLIIPDTTDSDINSSAVLGDEAKKAANVYRWTLADYDPPALEASRPMELAVAD